MSKGIQVKRRGRLAPEHCYSFYSPLPLFASTLLALDPWLQVGPSFHTALPSMEAGEAASKVAFFKVISTGP